MSRLCYQSEGFEYLALAERHTKSKGDLQEVEVVGLDVRDDRSVRACVQTVLDKAGRMESSSFSAPRIVSISLTRRQSRAGRMRL